MEIIPNLKYKTTLCASWLEGIPCEKDSKCHFAHGEQQLRTIEQNQEMISQRNKIVQSHQPYNNYKTVYCKFYNKGGCKMGDNCTFAHQKKEKRKIPKQHTIYPNPYALYPQAVASMGFYQSNFYYAQYFDQHVQAFEEKSEIQIMPMSEQAEKIEEKDEQLSPGGTISKSEQKKKSRMEECSTSEKEKQEVQNQEDPNEKSKLSSDFNCL